MCLTAPLNCEISSQLIYVSTKQWAERQSWDLECSLGYSNTIRQCIILTQLYFKGHIEKKLVDAFICRHTNCIQPLSIWLRDWVTLPSTRLWRAVVSPWISLTGPKDKSGSAPGKVKLPSLLWSQGCCLDLLCSFTAHRLLKISLLPLPSLISRCLTVTYTYTGGHCSGAEAFIFTARQDADMERAALLQRATGLSESMQVRNHIWDLHTQKEFPQTPHKI